MAVVTRVRRLVNPRPSRGKKRRAVRVSGRKNPKHRRRLTPAQIRAGFGGKRRQASLKAVRKRKRTTRARANPGTKRPKIRYRTRVKTVVRYRMKKATVPKHRRRRRTSNPGLMVTLGPALANPRKRRKIHAMEKPKRRRRAVARANPRRRRTYVAHRRRSNPVARHHRRRAVSYRRRNPGMFGTTKNMAVEVGGGLVGVTATKMITSMLPSGLTSSPLMRVVTSIAVAFGAGKVAEMMSGKGSQFAKGVMFGGLMQAGSVALNAFLPSLGATIGLAGLAPSSGYVLPEMPFGGFPLPPAPAANPMMMLSKAF